MSDERIEAVFREKASTDGVYAVAFALMRVADAQFATARALNRLGVGDAATHFGAIESLGMQVKESAEALDRIAGSISEIGQQLRDK